MFQVYIIYSPSSKKLYKGQTENLEDCLTRHNNAFEIPTKMNIPWVLLWSTEKASLPEAVALERKLINLTTNRIVKFILSHHEGIPGHEAYRLLDQMVKI